MRHHVRQWVSLDALAEFATLSRSNDRIAAILVSLLAQTSTALVADALQLVITTGAEFRVATNGTTALGSNAT